MDSKMLTAHIDIKLTMDGKQWNVVACSANIENKDFYTIPPGEVFSNKDEAIAELKRRIRTWFKERGRPETKEKIEWRVP